MFEVFALAALVALILLLVAAWLPVLSKRERAGAEPLRGRPARIERAEAQCDAAPSDLPESDCARSPSREPAGVPAREAERSARVRAVLRAKPASSLLLNTAAELAAGRAPKQRACSASSMLRGAALA